MTKDKDIKDEYPAIKVAKYYRLQNGKIAETFSTETLLERGIESLIGRRILQYSITKGDYDNGSGPGFFGLLLQEDSERKFTKEWLIATIAGADGFILFDSQWLSASLSQCPTQKPLIYHDNKIGKLIDCFGPLINDSTIVNVELEDDCFTIKLNKDNNQHVLKVLKSSDRLAPYPGLTSRGDHARIAFKHGDKMSDYIIFVGESGKIYV